MANSVEQIVNQAWMQAGRTRRIAYIYEGSEEAKVALELYGQARDELLRVKDWSFSRRALALTLLKGPPPDGGYNAAQPWSNIYPYPGFLYEYGYPADCLDLRALIWPPGSMPDGDPLPAVFRVDNDAAPNVSGTPPVAAGPPAKVILCNVTDAVAVYRAQVTDPASWEPGFTAALVAALAKKFAKAFAEDANTVRDGEATEVAVTHAAGEVRG